VAAGALWTVVERAECYCVPDARGPTRDTQVGSRSAGRSSGSRRVVLQRGSGSHESCWRDAARQAKVLTTDLARRIANNLSRLPELLRQAERD
jgi:hypothetical protein